MKVLKLALTHRGFMLTIFIKAFGNNMGRFRWCESWSNNMVIIWLIGQLLLVFTTYCHFYLPTARKSRPNRSKFSPGITGL